MTTKKLTQQERYLRDARYSSLMKEPVLANMHQSWTECAKSLAVSEVAAAYQRGVTIGHALRKLPDSARMFSVDIMHDDEETTAIFAVWSEGVEYTIAFDATDEMMVPGMILGFFDIAADMGIAWGLQRTTEMELFGVRFSITERGQDVSV